MSVIDCQRHIVLGSDVDCYRRITRQTTATALSAGLVVVIKAIAQDHISGWRIGVIAVGNRTNNAINLYAACTRTESNKQLTTRISGDVCNSRAADGNDIRR